MPDKLKVFIVGPARSGTSITYYAMHDVFDLPGLGESHVFPIFQRITFEFFVYAQRFAQQSEILASALDTKQMKHHVFNYIRELYQTTYRGERWVDKTPGAEAIHGVTLIAEAFPDAKIIVTKRNGIEVVQSIQAKFGTSFAEACEMWTLCMRNILEARGFGVPFLELDQFDLTNDPHVAGKGLAAFLGQPDAAERLAGYFLQHRTDKLSRHDWTRRLTLQDAGWAGWQQETFRTICGATMEAFGYAM